METEKPFTISWWSRITDKLQEGQQQIIEALDETSEDGNEDKYQENEDEYYKEESSTDDSRSEWEGILVQIKEFKHMIIIAITEDARSNKGEHNGKTGNHEKRETDEKCMKKIIEERNEKVADMESSMRDGRLIVKRGKTKGTRNAVPLSAM